MKKKILALLFCVLLTGCSSNDAAQKIDEKLMNHFPSNEQALLEEVNPDLITMEYLINHSSDYATDLSSDRNDFFVVVHGTVANIETEEYDDEILDRMDPEIADLLRGKTKTEIFFNDCSTPLTDSDSDFDVEIGNEYYFFVYVQEDSSGYRYTPFACYDFN